MKFYKNDSGVVFSLPDSLPDEHVLTIIEDMLLTEISESDALSLSNTSENIAVQEHNWVKGELGDVDIQLLYHWTNDKARSTATEELWQRYAVELRNYTSLDESGLISITASKRPTRPD
ncbi:hypothetical protein GCS60_000618 [Vibrio metschnikovii]|nr:hypothetical protein [Vibrio metschnikovii]